MGSFGGVVRWGRSVGSFGGAGRWGRSVGSVESVWLVGTVAHRSRFCGARSRDPSLLFSSGEGVRTFRPTNLGPLLAGSDQPLPLPVPALLVPVPAEFVSDPSVGVTVVAFGAAAAPALPPVCFALVAPLA